NRRYTEKDLPLAQELAHRAALALDNARLYEIARHAIEARDEVVAIVAHDLRNPLGIILGQAQSLQRGVLDGDRRAPERIRKAADRMNRLIQDLLDVTRMEAGRFSVEPRHVPVEQLLQESVEAEKSLVAAAKLELQLDVAADLPAVSVDHGRLLQVIENL